MPSAQRTGAFGPFQGAVRGATCCSPHQGLQAPSIPSPPAHSRHPRPCSRAVLNLHSAPESCPGFISFLPVLLGGHLAFWPRFCRTLKEPWRKRTGLWLTQSALPTPVTTISSRSAPCKVLLSVVLESGLTMMKNVKPFREAHLRDPKQARRPRQTTLVCPPLQGAFQSTLPVNAFRCFRKDEGESSPGDSKP